VKASVFGPVTAIKCHGGNNHLGLLAAARQVFESLALKEFADFGRRRPPGVQHLEAVIERQIVCKCVTHIRSSISPNLPGI
jgi:hypothetical protein